MSPVDDSMARLLVFLKAPEPGRVKTRLAASVGPEKACEFYRELVETLIGRIEAYPRVELRVAPDEALVSVADWSRSGWEVLPQGDGSLGDRLARAFRDAFETALGPVMAIGSDCPEVTLEHLEEAQRSLRTHSVVLGPARDGGYWLIGLNRWIPELFYEITWSTESVLQETLDRAKQVGLTVDLLEELEDVDDWASWQRYRERAKKLD